MNVREFLDKFATDADKHGGDWRSILLLENRHSVHNVFADLLESPGIFIVNVTRKDVTHPSGAKLWVRDAMSEHDRFRVQGLEFDTAGVAPGCHPLVAQAVLERVRGDVADDEHAVVRIEA
jgi:hypothetical protein